MCNVMRTSIYKRFNVHQVELSPEKSTATRTKEGSLLFKITVDITAVPTLNNPKILGVSLPNAANTD